MRYAYALTTALALSGAAAAMTLNVPAGAQTAQNEPGAIQAAAPRAGAPMSFADMVAKLQPAVVNISTTQRITQQAQANPFAGTPFEQLVPQQRGPSSQKAESLGSGFIISADGYVVTNNHVIAAGAAGAKVESITVTLPDRREFKARLVGSDPLSDLAVLKIEGANLPFVRFGDSRAARVGDWVVAIGNPFGLGGSVTAGIISATHRVTGGGAYDRFLQTDASINRGNSGGPMFDLAGNVIGINSQILSPTGGNVGIGFAIPAEQAKPVIDTLMKGGKVQRGYLGVQQQAMSRDIAAALGIPADKGALIASVLPGEAAEKAGIRQGDVIVRVNNQDVTEEQTLSFLTANLAPGTRVPIEVLRDGRRQTLTVTLGTRPAEDVLAAADSGDGIPDGSDNGTQAPAPAAPSLGLTVQPLTPQIMRSLGLDATVRGVVVVNVDPNSDAASKGFQRGTVIVSANGTPVLSAADLARAVAAAKAARRPSVLLLVQTRGPAGFVSNYVPVEIPE